MTEREALAVRLGHMSKWFTDQSYEAITLREAQEALAATPAVRDEDQEYADTMRSVAQLLRADSVSKSALDTKIVALAEQLWRVHPREIQDLGITRQQYYEREIRALFDTATPAVGGEIETAFLNLCEALGLQATPLAYLDAVAARTALAIQPASPLRGREDLAPSPCSDLSIGELIEWLDNPQWTNGYLNSDAANHISAAAELIERLVSSAPPEQPAAAPVTGRFGEPVWPGNENDDLDKGDDA